jgi:hypothetical protein
VTAFLEIMRKRSVAHPDDGADFPAEVLLELSEAGDRRP